MLCYVSWGVRFGFWIDLGNELEISYVCIVNCTPTIFSAALLLPSVHVPHLQLVLGVNFWNSSNLTAKIFPPQTLRNLSDPPQTRDSWFLIINSISAHRSAATNSPKTFTSDFDYEAKGPLIAPPLKLYSLQRTNQASRNLRSIHATLENPLQLITIHYTSRLWYLTPESLSRASTHLLFT